MVGQIVYGSCYCKWMEQVVVVFLVMNLFMFVELFVLFYFFGFLQFYLFVQIVELYYGCYYCVYVDVVNVGIFGIEWEEVLLEEIVCYVQGMLFDVVVQVWNYGFYWQCLCLCGGGELQGWLGELVKCQFGDVQCLCEEFNCIVLGLFGLGWVWLVQYFGGQLGIQVICNVGMLLIGESILLLCCDVWEYVYYIDYQNDCVCYLDVFWQMVNWDFVESQLC